MSKRYTQKMSNLDYFTGGVPAQVIFEMNIEGLNKIIQLSSHDEDANRKALEVCFIGLISYFEAFMKDHFASLLNICPQLLIELKKNQQDTTLNAADILLLQHNHINKIGFLIASKYDMGIPYKINSLYNALLQVSPFSKDEKEQFDKLLNDRNLIVHHGGIYSLEYSRQNHTSDEIPVNAFYHSLIINQEYFKEALEKINNIVKKTVEITHKKLTTYISTNNVPLNEEQQKAIGALKWSLD